MINGAEMAKNGINQKKAAKEFAEHWSGKGYEKGESQLFWIELLQKVYCVENIGDFIVFEDKVHIDHTSFIDAYIPSTHVMIEQKSLGKDLRKPIKQSDGSLLTPFQQAKRYSSELPYSSRPRWIITCNFSEFLIYDMEKPQGEPVQILLKDLPNKTDYLQFLVNPEKEKIDIEAEISLKAGELVGKLYDAILKQYKDPESDETLKSLNILCVRLVFLLYAEDAGIFAEKDMFGRYLAKFRPEEVRKNLMELFVVLNTKPEERDPYLNDDLAAFPYINGGLFAERNIEIPRFNDEIVDILVNKASAGFDWSKISPTIFGAVFESTLNPETRRKGGMHYTSIENIHKVIDPLFLDDLRAEFCEIMGIYSPSKIEGVSAKADGGVCGFSHTPQSLRDSSPNLGEQFRSRKVSAKTKNRLEQFRNKLAGLKFLDPACGSGNFLTETYISLRRLENECLKVIHGSQTLISSEDFSPIKVKISQFYGIEINDFAVTVAKTALWIAESQMMKETEEIVERDLDFLPLSTSATIVEGNALRMDWATLKTYEESNKFLRIFAGFEPETDGTRHEYDYIMGNPPFVGRRYREKQQQEEISQFFKYKDIDYVACWYYKAAQLISGTKTKCAFVSTNSITQGEQVSALWKPMLDDFKINIDFAYRTFVWNSESTEKAHVHCVIIGFSNKEAEIRREVKIVSSPNNNSEVKNFASLYNADGTITKAKNINGYLLDAPNIFISNRSLPLCDVPVMKNGNVPLDGDALKIEPEDYPKFKDCPWLKRLMGGRELLHNEKRYVLWLVGAAPNEIKADRKVYERVELCRKNRLSMKDKGTRQLAETPTTFRDTNNPENYIAIPMVSSESRQYIPMAYLHGDVIPTNQIQTIPNATLYHFGVLTSSVHNAWMRAVCGRLKSDYRYSKDIVYNNFPWPCKEAEISSSQNSGEVKNFASLIERTAQAILDARAKYPDSSLADLYDENTMPPELRKAHKENDKAVMQAYGFNPKMTESEIVAELFKMYEKLTK